MNNKSKKILSEVSAGELIDKISILEIKLGKIKDKNSLIIINKEYKSLKKTLNLNIKLTAKIRKLIKSIKVTNLKLWNIEDQIRVYEKNSNFGKKFILLARSVYFNNDKRAKIKSQINKLLKSNISEVKKYVNYN